MSNKKKNSRSHRQRSRKDHNRQAWLIGSFIVGTSLAVTVGAYADDLKSPIILAADTTAVPAASTGSLDDITVTARRRNESLQDVPIAISVLNGDDWAEKGGETIKTLQFEVPNTVMNLSNPRQTQTAIRALGMNPASDGLASSVGYYLDGVYLDRPGMASPDLFDLKQIEVLKGPQGTLFGKNTTAGALNIQTAQPTFTNEVRAETTFGTYNTEEYRTVLNGVIGSGNVLAVRASLYDDTHDGYLKDTDLANSGDAPNNKNRQGGRLQFLYEPDPDFKLLFRNDYAIEHDNDGASILYSTGPTAAFASYLSRLGLSSTVVGPSYTTDANASQNMMTRNYGSSVDANWTLDGGYTLTSVSAFRDYFFRPHNDSLDMQTLSAYLTNYYSSQVREKEQEVTQEIRFASPTGGKADYVVGGYYLWRRESASQQNYYPEDWGYIIGKTGSLAATYYLDGAATHQDADPSTQSFAVFGQGDYHIDNQFTLTAGLRETFEENSETILQYAPVGGTAAPNASQGYYNGSIAQYSLNLSEMATLSYKPVDTTLTYLTLSHGAKANGFNTTVPTYVSSTFLPTSTLLVAPEKAYNAEVGVKESVPSQRLTVNADLFVTKVFDYQSNETLYVNGIAEKLILNAGSVQTQGLEVDTSWKPIADLKLSASGAYDLADYKSYRSAPNIQGESGTQDLTGQRLVNAPRWSGVGTAVYSKIINDDAFTYASVTYSWKDWQYGGSDNSAYSVIKAYGVTNLRLGVNIFDKYDVALFADNIFDTRYFYSVSAAGTGYGYTGAPGSPRVVGVNLKAKF